MTTALIPTSPMPSRTPLRDMGVRTASEVRQAYVGQPRFVVESLIHSKTTMVYGLSEAGKTWLMVDMITKVSAGQPWLGQSLLRPPRRCLVLASDSGGEAEWAGRLGDSIGGNVLLWTAPPPNPPTWAALAEAAVEEEVDLVVVDTLYAWVGPLDVNKNAEVAVALACLEAMARVGVSVVVVHHTNVGGKRPGGSHSIQAYFRHSLKVTRTTMQSHGNDAPAAKFRLTRDGGRVIRSVKVEEEHDDNEDVSKTRSIARKEKLRPRHQEAVAILETASPGLSQREYGRLLHERMTSVESDDAGHGLVKTLLVKGAWTIPLALTSLGPVGDAVG